jgi:MoaA/NifB/PqqE/SkfB family radical SAM enzyme
MNTGKKYCAAPWRGLHLNFEGQVQTCCAANPNMLGKKREESIESILNSKKLQQVRESIKSGKLHPKYCEGCIIREDAGFESERDWHNNISPDFDCTTADIEEHKPALIDIRWNNTCNLACTYCGTYFSSKWAAIREAKEQLGENLNQTINTKYQPIIDYINKHQSHVKEVALVGGEPLMMKENNALLDILPDDVLVTVITNMTTDFDKLPVPQKLLKRSRVGWSMSFDNIGKRFEYVRWGSTWEQMNKNVSRVANKIENSQHHGGIQAVYTIYNCTRLCELKQYAIDKKINIVWQRVWGDHLNPVHHNKAVRTLAIEELHKYQNNFELTPHEKDFVVQQIQQLEQSEGKGDSVGPDEQNFKNFTKALESKWHIDQKGQFEKLWPELAAVI